MTTARKVNSILSSTALTKPSRRAALISMMMAAGALVPQAAYAIDDLATPTGETVVGGSASFDRPNAGQLNINQNTDRVVINWDSFNIGQNATTQFYQPGSNSLAVNRVTGKNDDPTQILGTLKANGRVMVLDRNGVFFGANSRVDVGGIIASTGDVDNAAVMGGSNNLQFNGFGDGSIVNAGSITAAEAGLVAFVGKNVANNGVINARLGKVALAAGDSTATVDLYGDGLVEFALDDAKSKVVASNSGVINAEGGVVAMSAVAAKDIVDNVINMDGVINVSSVTVKGGKIVLSGGKSGKVTVSGKLNASGKNGGGKIDVKGQNVDVAETAEITSNAIGNGNGGNIDLIAQDHMDYRGSLAAKGGELGGNGGNSEISGFGSMGYSGVADLTASAGETGNLLLDPAFAVIHSGAINNPLGLGYLFSAQALANTMKTANTTVQATNFIDVGVGFGGYNTGNAFIDNILNFLVGAGNINLSTWNNGGSGTTSYGLTLKANTVNFNKDVKMGTGAITVDATNVNLGSTLYAANGTTLLGDSQLIGTAAVTTVNVKSNAAKINQAVAFADDATAPTTINVAKGTYNESVLVNKANVVLKGAKNGVSGSDAGRGVNETIITPNSPGFLVTANNVTIDGFEIVGATDNGIHVDNASNVTIKNNVIHDVDGDGIYANKANGLNISANKIYNVISEGDNTGSGIQILNTKGATIGGAVSGDENTIYDTGWDGVRVTDSSAVIVQNNDIDDVFRTGVYFGNTSGSTASGNQIDGAGRYGVNVSAGGSATVTGNNIDNSNLHGINFANVGGTNLIDGNYVDNTITGDGIHAEDVSGLTVSGNFIGTSGVIQNIHGDGIYGKKIDNAVIKGNEITQTKSLSSDFGSGIQLTQTKGVLVGGINSNDANIIYKTGWDGVRLTDAVSVIVQNNDIDDVFRTGVYFGNTTTSTASGNQIDGAGRYGVNVNAGGGATVIGNNIDNTGLHGINFNVVGDTNLISGNFIDNTVKGDGIHADTVTNLTVSNNYIGTDGGNINGDGIYGKKVNGVIIKSNEITQTKSLSSDFGSGIQLMQTSGATIGGAVSGDENTIYDTGWDGVRVTDSSAVIVQNNDIDDVFRTGVYFGNTSGSTASGNQIDGAGRYGVNVSAGGSATVTGNNIDNSNLHGINFANVGGTNLIDGNYVDNTITGDGIHAEDVSGLTVSGNFIGMDGGNIAGNGIFVDPSNGVKIASNTVTDAGLNGIYSLNNNDATITGNTVTGSGLNGILAEGGINVTIGSDSVPLDTNTVNDSAENGIEVDGVDGVVRVLGNKVNNSGADGVYVHDVGSSGSYDTFIVALEAYADAFVEVAGNLIDETGDDGIDVENIYGDVYIHDNVITNVGAEAPEELPDDIFPVFAKVKYSKDADGIHVEDVYGSGSSNADGFSVRIEDNDIGQAPGDEVSEIPGATDDGIEVINAMTVYVNGNDVYGSGDEGIVLGGGYWKVPDDNDDEGSQEKRVYLSEVYYTPWKAVVTNNNVKDSGDNGIQISGYDTIYVGSNDVINSFANGLYIAGANNGYVEVEGNTFTDNDTGAYFESGLIDLTGESNTFENGRVGLKFAPLNFGEGGMSYLELVDDDAPGVSPASENPPTNFGGTIGRQIFRDQSQYFVELAFDSGAFFAPGSPTWLNGLNSSYTIGSETIVPADLFGVLTPDQENFLESRFFHWIDQSSLGRFWFGGVPVASPAEIDQQDIFNQFSQFAAVGGQVNVVLLGLPRLGGPAPAPTAPGAFDPNAIEPQAGDETQPQNTAAMSPDELNQIQTAAGDAGGANSSCWSDASSAALSGTTTTFSFSSVVDQSILAQDSSCGASQSQ